MGKSSGMLLVSDYDNTFQYKESAITASGNGSVPALQPQNLRAVNRWIAGGGLFAIATARALGAFQKFAAQIPINAPIIVDNGGGLYDLSTEQYIIRKLLPEGASDDLISVETAFPGTSIQHITCQFEARQALIYQFVSGLTGENGKHNYSRAVHVYPPFFDIFHSPKTTKPHRH